MTTQLTFDLPRRTALGRTDFFVSDSNAMAVAWIDSWPNWPNAALLLHGEARCGKTHLVHVWCERVAATAVSGATLNEDRVAELIAARQYRVAIDDADRACERALLHLYNSCLESQGSVLMTGRRPPASWTIKLDDLGSRLRGALAVGIDRPDDALLGAVLVKHFADRQLRVTPELILYLVKHIERSFAVAANVAERLDAAALREARAVTIPLVREVLGELRDYSLPWGLDSGVT
jgi:chromosomal replication initiation ATPase DnaA